MHAAVIGGGWAGCAAAVTLARLGHRVTLYETAALAGGRARRVERVGLAIDNGQHLLLGAYRQTLELISTVHGNAAAGLLRRTPLCVEPLASGPRPFRLRARRFPSPFGLLAGLIAAKGLTVHERFALIGWFRRLARSGFRCGMDATVAGLLANGPPAAARLLWEPLCLATLNTPAERASAQVFANVLEAAFAGGSGASDYLFPTTDLSALFPDAALRFIEARGGRVALGTRARVGSVGDAGVVVSEGTLRQPFDAAVVAVGPHQLNDSVCRDECFDDAIAAATRLAYEPIATIWLGYPARMPLPAPMARLDDTPGQWVVDRSEVLSGAANDASRPQLVQLVSVVISASGPHDALDGAALVRACDAQLRRLVPDWPTLAWSQSIVERRATHACTPACARPATALPHPRVALAGDWLDPDFPATLEAATRTGVAAANALHRSQANQQVRTHAERA